MNNLKNLRNLAKNAILSLTEEELKIVCEILQLQREETGQEGGQENA